MSPKQIDNALRWFVLFSYWTILTHVLLSTLPWESVGADHVLGKAPDFSAPLPSILTHWAAYFVLGCLIAIACRRTRTRVALIFFLAGALHGGVTEWLQQWVPNRWPNPVDFLCNLAGIESAWILIDGKVHYRLLRFVRPRFLTFWMRVRAFSKLDRDTSEPESKRATS